MKKGLTILNPILTGWEGTILDFITRLRGLIPVMDLSRGPISVLDVLVSLFLLDDVK